MIKTSVIFPARNEEVLIKSVILDVYRYLKKKPYQFEILVVVNGCNDDTEKTVKELAGKYKQVKLITSSPGYGYALRRGLEVANGNYIVVYNVDFYDLSLIDLIDIDLYGRDFIIGSKRAHWSTDKRSLSRRMVSLLFNSYLKWIYGFKGSDTHGIKVLKRKVLDLVYKKCNTYSGIFDTELVVLSQIEGVKIADFPVDVREIRPPRFVYRVFKTPFDILNLHRSIRNNRRDESKKEKELFYDEISETWNSTINNLETEKRMKVVYEYLLKGVKLKNKKFLEVGCGLGYFSKKATQKGALVTGLDIGENLIKKCKKSIPKANFVVGSATKLPFKADSFDVVLSTEVIEHTSSPREAIAELVRVTKAGGYLVITSPNRLWKPFFDFLSWAGIRHYHGNENWFTPIVLRQIITDVGGRIIRERHFNFFYPNEILDTFEKYSFLKYFMINQGYLITK